MVVTPAVLSYLTATYETKGESDLVKDKAQAGYSEVVDALKKLEKARVDEELVHREAIAILQGRLQTLELVCLRNTGSSGQGSGRGTGSGFGTRPRTPPAPKPDVNALLKKPEPKMQTQNLSESLDSAYEKRSAAK